MKFLVKYSVECFAYIKLCESGAHASDCHAKRNIRRGISTKKIGEKLGVNDS